MGKKLLLPTDFSISSWNAIQYAIKLYEDEDCDFYILNTYLKDAQGLDSATLLDPDDAFNNLSEKNSLEGLGDIITRLTFENDNPRHRFYVLSRPALFLEAVKEVVENQEIDIIVMGAKGMANGGEGKYGKNTLSVIANIRKCPVLVVPKDVAFDRPEEIVLATNFCSRYSIAEIRHLVEIAKISKASIQILSLEDTSSLNAKQKENKALLCSYLIDVDHSFNVLHNVKMADALSCFVEIRHSNMISYIDKKFSIWERLGIKTPALGRLGYFKNVPVLALHG
ncbi:MAG TPA: universal stress protein [Pricia sp.]|nr:universal stress protein [Pricia sp.]